MNEAPRPRPGGLTALAVLNFIFAGFGVLGLFALIALRSLVEKGADQLHISHTVLMLSLVLGLVNVFVMIAAGVGYLGMKKYGRTFGNVYAILALAGSMISMTSIGMSAQTVIGLIYPVLTLIFVNTTYKDDLVN